MQIPKEMVVLRGALDRGLTGISMRALSCLWAKITPHSSIPLLYSRPPPSPFLVTTQTRAPESLRTGFINSRPLFHSHHARGGSSGSSLLTAPVGLRANLSLMPKSQGLPNLNLDPWLLSTVKGRGSCVLQPLRR